MHPAPSMIVFTVLTGIGLGMVAWIGLGLAEDAGWAAVVIAVVCAAAGGVASIGHLARPSAAFYAFTQWRSSWLSREACLLLITMAVFGLYAGLWLLGDARIAPLGWIAAALAIATVYATAMIYASIRAVPRWSGTPTPALFLGTALAGGLLATGAAAGLSGEDAPLWLVPLALIAAAAVAVWWQTQAAGARRNLDGSTIGTATGLSGRGRARLFEPPHTGPNYLLREMAFRVGRERAFQLRRIGAVLGYLLPLLLAVLAPVVGAWLLIPALLSHVMGMLALRWLFFAEAEHLQALYYGAR
ncbi:MAG TPA: DmsC/YnfH family molybdoenzyme membrane anchor subunit [Paracoccaceae bacterium]|nr:DmsC/YnfH family molybdoenzyme membrane anchor subunit [Paracoccaceae bacterium]